MLKIAVLLKFYKGEIGPFDSSALECALENENAEITLLAMAPLSCEEQLKHLSRLGAKRAILISDTSFAGSDTLATAKVLSKAIEKLAPDVVLCGRQSMDGDTAQVPAEVATMCGYNLITNAMDFNLTEIPTRLGKTKVNLPLVVSLERVRTLRFPSLRSKPVPVEIWDNSVIALPQDEVGNSGSPTKVLKVYEKQENQRKCKFISSSQIEKVINDALIKPTVQTKPIDSKEKLDKIFVVGGGLDDLANSLAKKTYNVDASDPKTVAKTLTEMGAKHVLFKATIENRTLAPCVSAILNCGLAADCIGIETDGKNMFCYRPAASDSVIAKIGFKSGIEMATVRSTETANNDVIFSVGYGGVKYLDKIKKLAEKFGATVTASRKAVDGG